MDKKDEQPALTIVLPVGDDDALSEALRLLTRAIDFVGVADGKAGGLFGGEYGYGANYENSVFLMHRFCWCDEESCLWCGGSSCRGDISHDPHTAECYQSKLHALKRQFGKKTSDDWYIVIDSKQYAAARDRLCATMGLDPLRGSEVHCSCGVDKDWKRRYDACECDWHRGRGIYRFGNAVAAPNFWHKATGAQVRWYKYIGRGMETTVPQGIGWAEVFQQCHESLQSVGAVDPHDGSTPV